MHTSMDLEDLKDNTPVPYSPKKLIRYAEKLGFDCLALSHHNHLYFDKAIEKYAKSHGIVLIPAVERTIRGKHVVVLNARSNLEQVKDFPDLANLPSDTFKIAAHPYYGFGTCMMGLLEKYIDYIDAIEHSTTYPFFYNGPNKKAIRIAQKYRKPIIGNSDSHRLFQMGHTFTKVYAEKNRDSIIKALKDGSVRLYTRPLPMKYFIRIVVWILFSQIQKLFGIKSR